MLALGGLEAEVASEGEGQEEEDEEGGQQPGQLVQHVGERHHTGAHRVGFSEEWKNEKVLNVPARDRFFKGAG